MKILKKLDVYALFSADDSVPVQLFSIYNREDNTQKAKRKKKWVYCRC
jgi:hypothetical protein